MGFFLLLSASWSFSKITCIFYFLFLFERPEFEKEVFLICFSFKRIEYSKGSLRLNLTDKQTNTVRVLLIFHAWLILHSISNWTAVSSVCHNGVGFGVFAGAGGLVHFFCFVLILIF